METVWTISGPKASVQGNTAIQAVETYISKYGKRGKFRIIEQTREVKGGIPMLIRTLNSRFMVGSMSEVEAWAAIQ